MEAGEPVTRSASVSKPPEIRAMPKSGQLGFAVFGEQDVPRLDVAVQGARPVGRLERTGHLDAEPEHVAPVERTVPADAQIQRCVGVVLHHDERKALGRGPDLEDVDDVRVPGESSHRTLLTHEPLEVLRVEVVGQHLDRDIAVQCGLAAAIYGTVATTTDLDRIGETCFHQFTGDVADGIALCGQRIVLGHDVPRSQVDRVVPCPVYSRRPRTPGFRSRTGYPRSGPPTTIAPCVS